MKKTAFYLMILLSISYMTGCTPLVHHADPFYDLNDNDFPRNHLPLINPIEATSARSSCPWNLGLADPIWIQIPNSDAHYGYSRVVELEKFAVKDGVIMAYSSYVDKQADAYIQNNYYHWFVTFPDKNITKGFHTEDEFNQYIQTLGVQNPDWQTPSAAFDKFVETGGCLEWIPDCKQ
jgi:hypothetical protein